MTIDRLRRPTRTGVHRYLRIGQPSQYPHASDSRIAGPKPEPRNVAGQRVPRSSRIPVSQHSWSPHRDGCDSRHSSRQLFPPFGREVRLEADAGNRLRVAGPDWHSPGRRPKIQTADHDGRRAICRKDYHRKFSFLPPRSFFDSSRPPRSG